MESIARKLDLFYHKKVTNIIVSMVLSILFAIAVFTSSNPIWNYSGVDSACFILMGRGILSGKIPYLDLVDNKGPVLYFLNALGQFIFPNTIGIWILEILFLFVSLRTIAWITHKMNIRMDFLPQVCYLIIISRLIENGNMGEEYSNLFSLLAFAVALNYVFDNRQKISRKYGFSIGILFCLSFFIRPNNALPIAALIIVLAVGLIIQKDYKNLGICVLSAFLGFLIVFIPLLLYLFIHGAVVDWISQTFLVNLLYAQDSGQTILQMLNSNYGYKCLAMFVLSMFGIVGGVINRSYSFRMKLYTFAVGFAALVSFYSAFISRFSYGHYLLINTVPTIISLILLLSCSRKCELETTEDNFAGTKFKVHKQFYSKEYIVVFFSVMLICIMSVSAVRGISGNIIGFGSTLFNYISGADSRHSEMLKLAAYIPEKEKNSVYVLDGGTSNASDLYNQMGLLPCKRLFIANDRFRRLIFGIDNEYRSYFTTNPPKWALTCSKLNKTDYADDYDTICSKYQLVDSNDYGVYLYHRRE